MGFTPSRGPPVSVRDRRGQYSTANCIIIAQNLHFSDCFRGQFCKLPLLRVIFNRKLGDYYAIRSSQSVAIDPKFVVRLVLRTED